MWFNPVDMIARRRANQREDTDDELQVWIQQYVQQKVPDYQMAAWLMAVCFHPLSPRETATLTRCYAESGTILDWPEEVTTNNGLLITRKPRPPMVDKHSSGGVGDKVSLILAPLVAACEDLLPVWVPMMAGRGLGHTGGTIDKLESLVGYNPRQSVENFQKIVQDVGCAIVCATRDICPADQRLYALRDVTSTVSSLPLQTASIMSKKIAEHPDSITLDVKFGHGSFNPSIEEAERLAKAMVAVGEANGLHPTTAFLTDMNFPLGYAVGNWLEVKECIEILKGNVADGRFKLSWDLIILVVIQAGQMLYQSQYHRIGTTNESGGSSSISAPGEPSRLLYSLDRCTQHAYQVLDSGRVLEKFRQMMLAQGADPSYLEQAIEEPDSIALASFVSTWTFEGTSGYIHDVPAKTIGDISVTIGAGRIVANQVVDAQAGLVFFKQVGDAVKAGDIIVSVFTNQSQEQADNALKAVQEAIVIQAEDLPNPRGPIITHKITQQNGTQPFSVPEWLQKHHSHATK
ncbi:pyrimidine-nucleoside phosphorylase [Nitzschia inconspicua]|uniref:Thymidine phosphorylase n=1 Tax=Nitzschia inconspicua TaxID=303405 RepID=A0A9K3M0A0_9STRA|nr:pyrimidine-nucleoside phosphorylase [Nitzschia inconspicua]